MVNSLFSVVQMVFSSSFFSFAYLLAGFFFSFHCILTPEVAVKSNRQSEEKEKKTERKKETKPPRQVSK